MKEAGKSTSQTTNIRWQHYTGILLLSMGTLLLELTLISLSR
jgi:hypothetical protein